MFAYCRNNPANAKDPIGQALLRVSGVNEFNPLALPWEYSGGGGGGGVGSVVASAAVVVVIDAAERDTAKAETLALTQTQSGTYTVYFLCETGDIGKTIIYVGRVKTANFDARMNYHRTRGREYVASIDGLDYNTCRGMEQAGMVYFHTINRDAAINNQIRGISPTNKNLYIYMAALWDYIYSNAYTGNKILPLSFFANLTEEAFLNGTP